MQEVEMTLAMKYEQRADKPTTGVKDTQGRFWYVWNDKLGDFVPGHTYRIMEYSTYRTQQGKELNTIRRYQRLTGAQQAVTAAPNERTIVATSATSSPPLNQQRMDIFICGAFNNMMQNPNVAPLDLDMLAIADVLSKLKQAWLATFGPAPLTQTRRPDPITTTQAPPPPPQHDNPDLDDDIPF